MEYEDMQGSITETVVLSGDQGVQSVQDVQSTEDQEEKFVSFETMATVIQETRKLVDERKEKFITIRTLLTRLDLQHKADWDAMEPHYFKLFANKKEDGYLLKSDDYDKFCKIVSSLTTEIEKLQNLITFLKE